MIKICSLCKGTWAGGTVCDHCGGALVNPFDGNAKVMPEKVWRAIRFQYGARRGMLVRVIGALLGPIVAGVLLRGVVRWESPMWRALGIVGALATGFLLWLVLHVGAGRAVKIWVLRRGQLRKRRLAAALLKRAIS